MDPAESLERHDPAIHEDNKKGKNELVHHAASVGRSVEAVRLRSKKQEGWRIGGMKGR